MELNDLIHDFSTIVHVSTIIVFYYKNFTAADGSPHHTTRRSGGRCFFRRNEHSISKTSTRRKRLQ